MSKANGKELHIATDFDVSDLNIDTEPESLKGMFTKDDLKEAFEAGEEHAFWEIRNTGEEEQPPNFEEFCTSLRSWSATVDFSKQGSSDPAPWEILSISDDLILIQRDDDKIEITNPVMCREMIDLGFSVGDELFIEYG